MALTKKLKNLGSAAESKNWPKEVGGHFNKELDKLLRINPMAAEYPVAMNYVEFMLDLPWR
jgi:ATP-dependent Lon protease